MKEFAILIAVSCFWVVLLGASVLLFWLKKDVASFLTIALLFTLILWAVLSISTRYVEHRKFMETYQVLQDTAQGRNSPFEATGFSLKRMTDGRLLLSFTRPHAEDSERFFFVDVILPPKTATDLTPILEERQWQEKKE